MKMYQLIKDIEHPFGNFKAGTTKTVTGWMDAFGVDWLACFERDIESNPIWFKAIDV